MIYTQLVKYILDASIIFIFKIFKIFIQLVKYALEASIIDFFSKFQGIIERVTRRIN